jgi:ribulose-phosphate 3-epimerase
MIKALRNCFGDKNIIMDLHMCVDRPARYVKPMKDAGANLFIFQWEAVSDGNQALELVKAIVDAGMDCGLSINPSTDVDDIIPILVTGLVKVVDVLAVEPGFGGQEFQSGASDKIKRLLKLIDSGLVTSFEIMVDGECLYTEHRLGSEILFC